jgi:putative intracellular protease/amidase
VLAAICSGPRVLAYAQVVKGKKTTGEPSQTCQMLEQSGATCTGAEIERDGLIITARDRYASRAYVQAIIEAMRR